MIRIYIGIPFWTTLFWIFPKKRGDLSSGALVGVGARNSTTHQIVSSSLDLSSRWSNDEPVGNWTYPLVIGHSLLLKPWLSGNDVSFPMKIDDFPLFFCKRLPNLHVFHIRNAQNSTSRTASGVGTSALRFPPCFGCHEKIQPIPAVLYKICPVSMGVTMASLPYGVVLVIILY